MKSRIWLPAVTLFFIATSLGRAVENEKRRPHFDIRNDTAETSRTAVDALRTTTRAKTAKSAGEVAASMAAGRSKLAAAVPGLKVEHNPVTKSPEVLDATLAGAMLTGPSKGKPEAVVRGFVAGNAALFGLTTTQAGALETAADYANPAGNLSWVELRQTLNGIPVFQGTLRAAVRKDGSIVRTTGNLAGGLDAAVLPTAPTITAPDAAVAAAASLGIVADPASVAELSAAAAGKKRTLAAGPFVKEIQAELVYFPVEPGVATLAYSMVLWEKRDAWYVLVDAQTGQILWRKNITNDQTQAATYSVYDSDSPNPLSPTNATPGSGIQAPQVPRVLFNLISDDLVASPLGWITDGGNTTTGNNVDAGLDITSPNGIDTNGRAVGSPNRVFDFAYNPATQAPTLAAYRNGVVTNLFFWTNRYHDRLYNYGFTEGARNFQGNNFGKGGLGNDFVLAEAQDSGGTNNANFATPPDGQSGRMQMYIFTGPNPDRDGDLDQEIVIHELTHGLSNRLHSNGSGLNTDQSGGMGEGWSDFYGRALLATADEDVNGVYAMGAYATLNFFGVGTDNSYFGIRRFPYAVKTNLGPGGRPHNPLTLADVDPGKIFTGDGAYAMSPIGSNAALEVHNVGEIWCMALLEVRARIITRMGFAAGNDRTLQIITDAMKLDPASPTLIQARNSIVAAALGDPLDLADIWAGFAAVGMGFNASITNTTNQPATVVESFITPNLVLGNVTFTDADGNNDGFPDPGESIVLTLPISNLLATSATGVTVAVDGGAPVNVGTINPSQTVQQQFNYTVPPATPSGTRLKLTVDIDSSLGVVGPVPHSFFLIAGHPVNGLAQNFDALPGVALPTGWTTSRTGSGVTWVVSTTNSDTPTKNAFSPNVGATGSAEMVTTSIAIDSPSAQLIFRTAYNMEVFGGAYWDGMVLEMSVNGGAFEDIIEAGGEFLSGGYNVTLAFSSNPIGGRNGWGGLSGGTTTAPGYITTRVLLPQSVNGKSVRFKWIVGCDSTAVAAGSAGVRIDGVLVASGTEIGAALNRPPVINPQTFGVVEFKPNGFVIGTVVATESDPLQALTYTIESGNTGGAFALNSTTGQLTVANSTAVDSITNPTFNLDVKVTDNGTVGGQKSANATVTVNVRAPGVTPSIIAEQMITTPEDTGRTIVLADFTIDDPDSVPTDFVLTVLDGTNYTHVGNIITPIADFNGTLTVPVRVTDGESDSIEFPASVGVTPVNDAPNFVKGPNQPIIADGLPRTVPMWATAISTGPADEAQPVQTPSFTVTTSNDGFFTSAPTVSETGTLDFTAAAGMLGTVTVTVVMHDDGGMLLGGIDMSAGQSFVISSTAVTNDPPSFFVGADQAAAQDAGPQTVPNFASAISPGPPDEAGQFATLAFEVSADKPELFDVPPAISATGVLTYTPKATASGNTLVTVVLNDHGGTAGGGDETSDAQTFMIAVTTFTGHDGIYNGLSLPALATPSSAEKTGLLGLKLMATRSFTGKLKLGIDRFILKGVVDNAGVFHFGKTGDLTLRLERKGRTPFFLELRLDVAGTSDRVTGTIRGEMGPPEANLSADRTFYSKDVPPPFKGKFTVIFDQPVSPVLLSAAMPQGDGYAAVVVTDKGLATIDGYLADGSKVKYSNTLSKTDSWPLYVPFSKGNGALAGQVQFRVVPDISDVDGADLLWFRPQDLKKKKVLYPGGWPKGITTSLVGSTYVPGLAVANSIEPALVPTVIHDANLLLTGGNLSGPGLTRALKLDGKKVMSVLDTEVAVTFTLTNGVFKGTFLHPTTQKKATIKGAVLQKQKVGFGYFYGDGFSTTGGVVIDPLP